MATRREAFAVNGPTHEVRRGTLRTPLVWVEAEPRADGLLMGNERAIALAHGQRVRMPCLFCTQGCLMRARA